MPAVKVVHSSRRRLFPFGRARCGAFKSTMAASCSAYCRFCEAVIPSKDRAHLRHTPRAATKPDRAAAPFAFRRRGRAKTPRPPPRCSPKASSQGKPAVSPLSARCRIRSSSTEQQGRADCENPFRHSSHHPLFFPPAAPDELSEAARVMINKQDAPPSPAAPHFAAVCAHRAAVSVPAQLSGSGCRRVAWHAGCRAPAADAC